MMNDTLISGVITRAAFCCNKIVKNLRVFLTEIAAKSCIYAQATLIFPNDSFAYNPKDFQTLSGENFCQQLV